MTDELEEMKAATYPLKKFNTPEFTRGEFTLGGDKTNVSQAVDFICSAANPQVTGQIGVNHLKPGADAATALANLGNLSASLDLYSKLEDGELPTKTETAKVLAQAMNVFNEQDDYGKFAKAALEAAGVALGVGDLKKVSEIDQNPKSSGKKSK